MKEWQRNEINNLIIFFFSILIKKSQMMGCIFPFSLLLKSQLTSNLDQEKVFSFTITFPFPYSLKRSKLQNLIEKKIKLGRWLNPTILERLDF